MEAIQTETTASVDQELEEIEKNSKVQKKPRLMPQKGDYRMRAHINPLCDTPFPYPLNPDFVNWRLHYPKFFNGTDQENQLIYVNTNEHPKLYDNQIDPTLNGSLRSVDFLDIGCGFGGLLFELSKHFPDKLSFGLEIRDQLVNFIGEKIRALRIEKGECNNISVVRTNAMRHLLQYFRKEKIQKMFFLFADPHFKEKNKRRRIINTGLLSEYAYLLKQKGRIYCITDVEDLFNWEYEHIKGHQMFRILSEEELKDDLCYQLIQTSSEQSKKVDRIQGQQWAVVAEQISIPK